MKDLLSKRELEVAEAYCRDFKDVVEIAKERFRSPSTIQTQLFRIRRKIGASNNRHLVALYWQWRSAGDREFASWNVAPGTPSPYGGSSGA